MWEAIINFLITQNSWAGIAILCLGAALVLFYKETAKERSENKEERKETTDKVFAIATESVKYIQESTGILKDMRDEMKQHNIEAQEHRRTNESGLEKLLLLLDSELKLRGKN